jgi:hypothetical protein
LGVNDASCFPSNHSWKPSGWKHLDTVAVAQEFFSSCEMPRVLFIHTLSTVLSLFALKTSAELRIELKK